MGSNPKLDELALVLDSIEDAPEALRHHYVPHEGKYFLGGELGLARYRAVQLDLLQSPHLILRDQLDLLQDLWEDMQRAMHSTIFIAFNLSQLPFSLLQGLWEDAQQLMRSPITIAFNQFPLPYFFLKEIWAQHRGIHRYFESFRTNIEACCSLVQKSLECLDKYGGPYFQQSPQRGIILLFCQALFKIAQKFDVFLRFQPWNPGTPLGDSLLIDTGAPLKDRNEALQRLAAGMTPGLAGPKAKVALRDKALERGISAKELLRKDFFPKSLLLAQGEGETLRTIRIGRIEWVKDGSGRKLVLPPVALPVNKYLIVLRQEVYKATEAELLGRPYPNPRRDPLDRAVELKDWGKENQSQEDRDWADWDRDPDLSSEQIQEAQALGQSLHESCEDELYDASRQDKALDLLLDIASPRQREIISLLKQRLPREEIAAELKVSRSTVDVQLHRLKNKAEKQKAFHPQLRHLFR